MQEFYKTLSELLRTHSKLVLATVIDTKGSTPRELGAKMVILPDGNIFGTLGGGGLEFLVMKDAQTAMKKNENILKVYPLIEEDKGGIGAACGGDATVFIEVITRGERLMILGGGHVGLELYNMALRTGFSTVVVDSRPEFVTKERFSEAELLINCSPDDIKLREFVDKDTYIVIMTHGHKHDKAAIKNLIDRDFRYLGMIGSIRKVRNTLEALEAEGVPRELLDKIYTPIGLDINAETPAEIAVSILAELVHVRRAGSVSEISLCNRKDIDV